LSKEWKKKYVTLLDDGHLIYYPSYNVSVVHNYLLRGFFCVSWGAFLITRESSYCFQRISTVAIQSVRPSVTRVDQSKTVQARITKFSSSAAWKTLVSGTVKLFHKFEGDHPERGRW